MDNEVAAVLPDSPASAAGIQAGDKITEAEFIYPMIDGKDAFEDFTIALSAGEPRWPGVCDALQRAPDGTQLTLTIERGTEKFQATLAPVTVDGLFVTERGFEFMPIERLRRATSLAEQLQYGWDETAEALTMVFRFLQKLGTQIPLTALGGPVMIAKQAGYSAYAGIAAFLIFLTMLSANLAVLNFLPIPLLDGGHMVFLAYEAVRGRPANERFVVALHTIGFVFIVSLMLFVLALDLNLIDRGL
jgi:regulator of sigma E protease